jgi:hypothetical protein
MLFKPRPNGNFTRSSRGIRKMIPGGLVLQEDEENAARLVADGDVLPTRSA